MRHRSVPSLLTALVVLSLFAPPARAEPADSADDFAPTERDPLVVGGSRVPDGKWQDAAAIMSSYGGAVCSGTLIAPDVVLTAGHCIGMGSSVVLGSTDLNQSGGEEIDIIQQTEYPNSYNTYDVGLLKLAAASTIAPRPIASGCIRDNYTADGADVAIVGFGAIDQDGSVYPDALYEAFTTISDADCSNDIHGCNTAARPDGELTAGGGGIDSCNGDSGGPLYLLTDRGEFLVGVTSRAFIDSTIPCSQGGIYVRPDKILGWLETTGGISLPEATCNAPPAPLATPAPVEVEAGDSVDVAIDPNDPDTGDSHVYAVATEPEHGQATAHDDGTVTYTADADYEGEDSFAIAVTDDGVPPASGTVVVPVTVLPGGGGCGCHTGGGGSGGGLFLFVVVGGLLWRRRRRY